jgi:hypothetical protein
MQLSVEIWKQIQFSNMEEILVRKQNQNNKLKEKGKRFAIPSDRVVLVTTLGKINTETRIKRTTVRKK